MGASLYSSFRPSPASLNARHGSLQSSHDGVNRRLQHDEDSLYSNEGVLNYPSLHGWGVSKIKLNVLASIAASYRRDLQLRGGGGGDANEDADNEVVIPFEDAGDQPPSIDNNTGDNKCSTVDTTINNNKSASTSKKSADHDEERYSRQMYALGARAHGLVRSTTAILDGPLGAGMSGGGSSHGKRILGEDVDVEGADGFEGLHKREGDRGRSSSTLSEVPSGLLYEIAKNLALSGVGRIILVRDDNNTDAGYFDGDLDDLGGAYRRAALAEIIPGSSNQHDKSNNNDVSEVEDEDYDDDVANELNDGAVLLAEYIQRLNPGVQVDIISRVKLLHLLQETDDVDTEGDNSDDEEKDHVALGSNPVVVCVDRSISAQLEMNDACRSRCQAEDSTSSVPFVSVETAGVYSRIFCDFGPLFVVVDEDGETPRSTLLEKVEILAGDDGTEQHFTVHCLEGERHDVSRGNVIEFQGDYSQDGVRTATFPQCEVVNVKSPTCFTVREWKDDESPSSKARLDSLLEGEARSFSRIKLPRTIAFTSLRDILHPPSSTDGKGNPNTQNWDNDSLFAPSDLDKSFDPSRRKAVMSSMAALDLFVKKYGRLPLQSNASNGSGSKSKRTDVERFQSLVQKTTKVEISETWDTMISQFARTCRAKFTPVQAFLGALGAQEVLKGATKLYNPVHQFLLYDCDEVLQNNDGNARFEDDAFEPIARGQSYILGNELSRKLALSRIFLVGAGAIGCELLKNLAAMGAGTGSSNTNQGCLIITDMDTIERSNLSRQLLFRDHDVGEFKSAAARTAVLRFLPDCRIEAHTSRVGEEEDGPFDDDFWSSGCSVVLNALDNVEARLFVDSQCVAHGLGLIDAGTLGPKGNVQVVIPHQSESYGSSADPPEPDIPVCTLKNFPYEISHTIQWARDLFDGYFHRRPRQANDHVEEMAQSTDLTNFAQTLISKLGEDAALDMAEELGEDLGVFPFVVGELDSNDPEYVSAVKKVCLAWAIKQAHRLFFVAMDELVQKHPIDSVDDDGALFWSGTRRAPKPFRFVSLNSDADEVSAQQVIINERIAEFVKAAARLRMESFLPVDSAEGTSALVSLEDALTSLEGHYTRLQSKDNHILRNLSGGDGSSTLDMVLEKLNGAKTGASFMPSLNLADFEKDDDNNGHVAFVTAASNLRALSYGIKPADTMETRRVAGRIVPAMITTTGLVSALSCLEFVKMLKGLPLNMHRNAFVNMALPFFAFTAPLPAEEVAGVNRSSHTIWDRVIVKGSSKSPVGAMTLRKFLDKVKRSSGFGDDFEVANLSYGPFMIYANFLHSEDDELLDAPLLDTVKEAVVSGDGDDDTLFAEGEEGNEENKDVANNLTEEQTAAIDKLEKKRFVDFSVTVENPETGEEYELPPVRLMRDKKKVLKVSLI